MNAATLLQENSSLKAALAALQSEFQTSLQTLQQEDKLLRQKLALFIQRYFGGQKNESLAPAQLELLLAGLTAAGSASAPGSNRRWSASAKKPCGNRCPRIWKPSG